MHPSTTPTMQSRRFEEAIEGLFARYQRHRDPADLEELFRQTRPWLVRCARRWSNNRDEIDDLVQNTCLVAVTATASFERGRRVLPWLQGILNNRGRRAHRNLRRVPDPYRCTLPSAPLDPLSECQSTDLSDRVFAAIGTAPPSSRVVLELHLHHGLQPHDIARWLRRPTSTVRTQLRRGLRHVRLTLAQAS